MPRTQFRQTGANQQVVADYERGYAKSGGAAIADALGVLSSAASDGIRLYGENEVRKLKEEEARISDLLSNPSLTPEEAEEIANSAQYRANQMLAQNRQGEALAESKYLEIEQQLEQTADPIEAREMLRRMHQELTSGATPGVAAGVSERMSLYQNNVLQAASARRKVRQKEADQVVLSSDFQALVSNPERFEQFGTVFEAHVSDAIYAKRSTEAVTDSALNTLDAWVAEGAAIGRENPRLPGAIAALDTMLDGRGLTTAKQRKAAGDMRESLINMREREISGSTTSEVRSKQALARYERLKSDIARALQNNRPVQSALLEAAWASAEDAQKVSEFDAFMARERGTATTRESIEARRSIGDIIGRDPMGVLQDPDLTHQAESAYDELVGNMQFNANPSERAQTLNEMAIRVAQEAKLRQEDRKNREEARLKAGQEAVARINEARAQAVRAGDTTSLERLDRELAELSVTAVENDRRFREDVQRATAISLGLDYRTLLPLP
jgi:hypothetical protein